jgi:hypothetical protein
MELKEPLILIMDETVELIFNVNQIPFRVRGKVRALRSEKMVGFQFPQLSERSRRQLEELIGELILRLVRLHQSSIAKPPVADERKHAHSPATRAALSEDKPRPNKHATGRLGEEVKDQPERKPWL